LAAKLINKTGRISKQVLVDIKTFDCECKRG
jgi:hypothetical protein